jgi:hypothetical protein
MVTVLEPLHGEGYVCGAALHTDDPTPQTTVAYISKLI